ncbi:MAG: D-tyrosyl-tRNA(Tyr) deacylase [Fluviicola sp.]|nr:D-tyrosyl-tRNA(Tyr) deacylase [Fluviicola sp.]MBP6272424.1 D-tyrosyl-tRNA(Tyr) deacylase [Fluviicola sp.]
MKIVIQRVSEAAVTINKEQHASIQLGLVVLVGIEQEDEKEDADWLVSKLVQLRIFSDNEGKMNESILDIAGELLIISQFTLHAATKKGNRPSFIIAARPEKAIPLYDYFIAQANKQLTGKVKTGIFGADMKVSLENDGPVTIIIDSKNKV